MNGKIWILGALSSMSRRIDSLLYQLQIVQSRDKSHTKELSKND